MLLAEVPADKTLVLQAVSGDIRAINRTPVVRIDVVRNEPGFVAWEKVRFTLEGQNAVGSFPVENVLVANDALHLYAPPGSSVYATALTPFSSLSTIGKDAIIKVHVLGYFVPAQ